MTRLALIGASGHGKVVADLAITLGWREVVFYDDAWPAVLHNSRWAVQGTTETFLNSSQGFDGVFVSIGDNAARKSIYEQLSAVLTPKISLISPKAAVSQFATIGQGVAIMPGAVVNADAKIGNGVIVNSSAVVEHDCVIGAWSHISPGSQLAGNVVLNDSVWVGLGSSVREGVRIAENTIVGAGSVVLKDVPANVIVVGVPAQYVAKAN